MAHHHSCWTFNCRETCLRVTITRQQHTAVHTYHHHLLGDIWRCCLNLYPQTFSWWHFFLLFQLLLLFLTHSLPLLRDLYSFCALFFRHKWSRWSLVTLSTLSHTRPSFSVTWSVSLSTEQLSMSPRDSFSTFISTLSRCETWWRDSDTWYSSPSHMQLGTRTFRYTETLTFTLLPVECLLFPLCISVRAHTHCHCASAHVCTVNSNQYRHHISSHSSFHMLLCLCCSDRWFTWYPCSLFSIYSFVLEKQIFYPSGNCGITSLLRQLFLHSCPYFREITVSYLYWTVAYRMEMHKTVNINLRSLEGTYSLRLTITFQVLRR